MFRKITAFICMLAVVAVTLSGCFAAINREKKGDIQPGEGGPASPGKEQYGSLLLDWNAGTTAVEVPFIPLEYDAAVEPYSVNEDLSNIENLEQFGDFTDEQRQLLAQNGFFVNPTQQEQLFYIYENNEYKKLPSFITVDSVLQVYHIFYDYSLRTLEQERLITLLEELTQSMLHKSIYIYNKAQNQQIRNIQLKNIAYFAVAQLALEKPLPDGLPREAEEMAKKEYRLITGEQGYQQSAIFPFQLDYSQYRPRGHYTRNDHFKRYFRAMMWYGQVPFPLYIEKEDGTMERNIEQTLQAVLISYALFMENNGSPDIERWDSIYSPTVFYVGNTDDLNVYHYRDLLIKVYGKEPDIDGLDSPQKLDHLYAEADKLPEPAIRAKYTTVNTPTGKQFRFMGQRYIPDSEILQELVEPIVRPIPSGLDVMGVLGSSRAYDLLINTYRVHEGWELYPEVFRELKEKFDSLSEGKWRSNMYYGWLWVLKELLKPFGGGYPSFMTNSAWEDKSISTALGSWAELRHDTILYGKQSAAECGGGQEPPQVKGYVEPNIGVYERLLWLTRYSRANLERRGLLTGGLESKMQTFEDLLRFLINCSIKELRNEELTQDEYDQLRTYGGLLEHLTSSFAGDGMRWFEITSDTDKNMAVIADIHTIAPNQFSPGGYVEVGVGPAYEIYVVVPIGGKLYLTRGAVFSYYEFVAREKRLTDEEWQKMLKEGKAPPQPEWMDSFIEGGKREVPDPPQPYSSGC